MYALMVGDKYLNMHKAVMALRITYSALDGEFDAGECLCGNEEWLKGMVQDFVDRNKPDKIVLIKFVKNREVLYDPDI